MLLETLIMGTFFDVGELHLNERSGSGSNIKDPRFYWALITASGSTLNILNRILEAGESAAIKIFHTALCPINLGREKMRVKLWKARDSDAGAGL